MYYNEDTEGISVSITLNLFLTQIAVGKGKIRNFIYGL